MASPSQNELDRMHWQARRRLKANWKMLIRATNLAAGSMRIPQANGPRTLTIERWSSGTLDTQNLIGGAKGIIDNLVQLGLLVDDRPEFLTLNLPVQRRIRRGETPYTLLILEEVA
jgi:hypothetical protein